MKLSDYVIKFLAEQGIQHVFQLIGGAITHLVDSTIEQQVACITMHHEQGAAFAAEGYARCNGKLGVAMATSGPGATNLITGIGSCYFDSVPCLFITGQVNTYEYKFDSPVRQVGFQETDIVSIIRPITKGARLVRKAEDIRADLEWAVHLAQSGRPGPVLLDIPMDIQRTEIDPDTLKPYALDQTSSRIPEQTLTDIIHCLSQAERPVVLIGGGVRAALATDLLFGLIDITGIPVVASLMGLDAFPHDHFAYRGMIGAYGNRYANLTIANADFLLVLGSRLDVRQTGTRPETFARAATIVHVDIDAHELNRAVQAEFPILTDIKIFLQQLLQQLEANPYRTPEAWLQKSKFYQQQYPSFPIIKDRAQIDANEFMHLLAQHTDDNAIVVLDVGQHQMWAAQSFLIKRSQRMLISGGMGSMGFALPTAIGAAFAEPKRQIIVIAGDGGFQMNMQELQTIIRHRLPIKMIVMNNRALGMVRQFQHIYFKGRMEGTIDGYDCPDFVRVVSAFGINSNAIEANHAVVPAIKQLLAGDNPAFLEVKIDQLSVVEPKLVVHHPIEDQDPKLPREELKALMMIPLVGEEQQ